MNHRCASAAPSEGRQVANTGAKPRQQRLAKMEPIEPTICLNMFLFSYYDPHTTRTTGKLTDIFVKGLRCQFQPLHHGEVGEELVGKIGHCHTVANGECGRLNNFASCCGKHLATHYPAALFFRHQLDESAGIEVGNGARYILQIQGSRFGFNALNSK